MSGYTEQDPEKLPPIEFDRKYSGDELHQIVTTGEGEVAENTDALHRRLNNRQIQLIAIGGSIGTALFVSIGAGLERGGPGSLFLAYAIYSCFLAMVGNGTAEMTILFPVSGGFVRLAGHFVSEAWGFMAGWNFFLYECLIIPFEITALTTVLGFWTTSEATAYAIPIACIILYGLINVLAVKAYGEAEFWLSGGKVILIIMLMCFTFISMVGGNPQGDAYGFRYWKNPGSFAEYRSEGTLGQFEGFCACLWSASFCIVGPEYISMVAAEAKRPRVYIKQAFKTIYIRLAIFFIGGALCAGIVVAYNDPVLVDIVENDAAGGGTAAASPYVIAMDNLKIEGLPHLVNALLVTSIFSAGNTYTYCATRSLYGMALEGRAPAVLKYVVKRGPMAGVPLLCLAVVMVFPFLSFLQVSNGSNVVLGWLINLVTAGGVITYIVMAVTYIFFHRACVAQGIDRSKLPYRGWFQPYCAYIGLAWMIMVVTCYGYSAYTPFDVQGWFIYYAMVVVAFLTFTVWSIIKRSKFHDPYKVDMVWERPTLDAYEATFTEPPLGFWKEMLQMVGIGKQKFGRDRRRSSVVVS